MVRKKVLIERIEKLEEYLTILAKKEGLKEEEVVGSIETQAVIERFLELAIQAINDIGTHIISDKKLGKVEVYSDVPRILHAQGMLSAELAETWTRMCGFRNILAHDYLKIDGTLVYKALQSHRIPFQEILKIFNSFLE